MRHSERGREHAGAICSQDLGLSSRPDLGKANNLQEQMSHPPFPMGLWVCHPRAQHPTNPQHLGGDPCVELGAQPESKCTLQRPGNLIAGVTPPRISFGNPGMAQRRKGSLLPPGTTVRCHLTGCHPPVPAGKDLESRLCPQSSYPATPLPWQRCTKAPGSVTTRT